MRSLISLGITLIIGLVVYNYFFGTPEDKENVHQITDSVKQLINSTKDKYKNGEYDEALKKVGVMFDELKEKAKTLGDDYQERLAELEREKDMIQNKLDETKNKDNTRSITFTDNTKSEEELKQELEALLEKVGALNKQME